MVFFTGIYIYISSPPFLRVTSLAAFFLANLPFLFVFFVVFFFFLFVSRARKAEERQRKEAELRRLKNLKREEIQKRLKAIQEMSGGALVDEGLGGADAGAGGEKGVGSHAQALLDEDFDPQR